MSDYTELVKALRWCASDETDCEGNCPYSFVTECLGKIKLDAAAAIEELQAEQNMYLTKQLPQDEKDKILEYIRNAPIGPIGPIEPMRIEQLPKRGEWVRKEGELTYWYECSECGYRPHIENYPYLSDFCPNCGVKMMEVQE